MIQQWLENIWYSKSKLAYLLWPFSVLFQIVTSLRRALFCTFFKEKHPIPIIVVGNLTVGGTGKTPLVIALAKACQEKSLNVGVVSRGYGRKNLQTCHEVRPNDNVEDTGDEPLLIAKSLNCPVVVAKKRNLAVHYLLKKYHCNVIISDDGLQHYRMGRTIEILVLDGQRFLGNRFCLPAGPLRENISRLKTVDFKVINNGSFFGAHNMSLEPYTINELKTGIPVALNTLPSPLAAVAGIGNPNNFFNTLKTLNITFHPYPFPDHHSFQVSDFHLPWPGIIMTEKDAIKCHHFAKDKWYSLAIRAKLDKTFWDAFWSHPALRACLQKLTVLD